MYISFGINFMNKLNFVNSVSSSRDFIIFQEIINIKNENEEEIEKINLTEYYDFYVV